MSAMNPYTRIVELISERDALQCQLADERLKVKELWAHWAAMEVRMDIPDDIREDIESLRTYLDMTPAERARDAEQLDALKEWHERY